MSNQSRAGVASGATWSADALARAQSVLEQQPSVEARRVMAQTRLRSNVWLGALVVLGLVIVPITILFVTPAELSISSARRTIGHVLNAAAVVLLGLGIVSVARSESKGARPRSPASALTRAEIRQLDAVFAGRTTLPPSWAGVAREVARRRASDLAGSVFVPGAVAALMLGRVVGSAGPFYQVAGAVLCVVALAVLVVRGLRLGQARRYLRTSPESLDSPR